MGSSNDENKGAKNMKGEALALKHSIQLERIEREMKDLKKRIETLEKSK